MSDAAFTHDVFLSHSSKEKAVVRPLAERLRKDGLKVWFDEWVLKAGDQTPEPRSSRRESAQTPMPRGQSMSGLTSAPTREEMIEEELEPSRVLVLCMSANAFGSDWAQLQTGPQLSTFNPQPTAAPLNQERRFIP